MQQASQRPAPLQAPLSADGATSPIATAAAALGPDALTESSLHAHIRPLFARVLDTRRIYLANHSLGRPLDVMQRDVEEGVAAWYSEMGGAWDAWSVEMAAYRSRLAQLLHAPRPDCVVPKTSAGQGLRAILNTYDEVAHVVSTRGEFDSLDVILREYALRGRIALTLVEPGSDGSFDTADVLAAIAPRCDLLVISQVMFNTGQRLSDLAEVVAATQRAGGRVLLDVYHSLGVLPVDVAALDVDFAVGGSYKYLRGGPGACFLYLHPRHLDGSLRTLDIGWFAKRAPFDYLRPDPPQFAPGGDAFLESTPPVLTCYQARAGQMLTLALRVHRLREYSCQQQRQLCALLLQHDMAARGGDNDHGAFVVITHPQANALSMALREREIIVDARGPYLRLCPDILTTGDELATAARALAQAVSAM